MSKHAILKVKFNSVLHSVHCGYTSHLHTHNTVIMSKDGLVAVPIVKAPNTDILVCRAGGQQCTVLSGIM